MHRRFVIASSLAAALLLSVSTAHAQGTETWQQLAPEGKAFSVMMPAPVSHETKQHPRIAGLAMESYQNESDAMLYHVASINIAKHFQANATTFNSFVAGFLNSYCEASKAQGLTCETTFERDLRLNAYTGKQYKVVISNNTKTLHGVVRIYMTPEVFYALQVVGGKEGEPPVDKFLKSFKLTPARPKP